MPSARCVHGCRVWRSFGPLCGQRGLGVAVNNWSPIDQLIMIKALNWLKWFVHAGYVYGSSLYGYSYYIWGRELRPRRLTVRDLTWQAATPNHAMHFASTPSLHLTLPTLSNNMLNILSLSALHARQPAASSQTWVSHSGWWSSDAEALTAIGIGTEILKVWLNPWGGGLLPYLGMAW